MKTAFGGDLAVVGSGCSGSSSVSGTTPSAPTKRTGGLPPPLEGSDARILAMLRRQLHGPKHVSLETEVCPAKLECQAPICSYTADLVEAGDLSQLLPLTALDQHCFDELAAISLAVATRAVPPGPVALRGVAALAGIRGIELVHRRLCDLLLDAAIADVSPAELEVILAAALRLPTRRAAVLSSMVLEARPALLASLPHLHVLSAAMPPPPTLVVRHLKLSFFPREDAQAGTLRPRPRPRPRLRPRPPPTPATHRSRPRPRPPPTPRRPARHV